MSNLDRAVTVSANELIADGTSGRQLVFLGFFQGFLGCCSTWFGHGFHRLLLLCGQGLVISRAFASPGCFLTWSFDTFV